MERELSLKLLRKELASIDLSDITEGQEELSEAERAEYCAAINAVWPRLEKDLKSYMHKQLIFAVNEAADWGQVLFARGTFNGMALLLEHWKQAHTEHEEKVGDQEQFEKGKPVADV